MLSFNLPWNQSTNLGFNLFVAWLYVFSHFVLRLSLCLPSIRFDPIDLQHNFDDRFGFLLRFGMQMLMIDIGIIFKWHESPFQQWHHANFTMATVLAATSIGFSNLFIFCFFGKLATECFEMISDCIYEMEWYAQPNELQKYFILMIVNMQKPIYYHGFDVAKLELRTFITVNRRIFK